VRDNINASKISTNYKFEGIIEVSILDCNSFWNKNYIKNENFCLIIGNHYKQVRRKPLPIYSTEALSQKAYLMSDIFFVSMNEPVLN